MGGVWQCRQAAPAPALPQRISKVTGENRRTLARLGAVPTLALVQRCSFSDRPKNVLGLIVESLF